MGVVNRLRGLGKRKPKKKQKCPKCEKLFSEYELKREKDGKILKKCPFCGYVFDE